VGGFREGSVDPELVGKANRPGGARFGKVSRQISSTRWECLSLAWSHHEPY